MDTPTMFEPTTVDQRVQPPPDTVVAPGSREQGGPWTLVPPDPGSLPLPFDPRWDVEESWSAEAAAPVENPGAVSSVFEANSALSFGCGQAFGRAPGTCGSVAEGFSGFLGLNGVPELGPDLTGTALQGLRRLEGWTAASRARLVHRQHLLMRTEVDQFRLQREAEDAQRRAAGTAPAVKAGRAGKAGSDRSLAFDLAAAEIATLLGIPEGTAMALIDESDQLCIRCPETLAQLETGAITLAQARTILDQTESLTNPDTPASGTPAADGPGSPDGPDSSGSPDGPDGSDGSDGSDAGNRPDAGLAAGGAPVFPAGAARDLEQELLVLAPGLTNAQLQRKARRWRERRYPQTIPVRHRVAFEERRVWFQPQSDGMGHLGAYLPAQQGQQILGALTGAARGEQAAGDPRGLAQLRADILSSLLLHTDEPWPGTPGTPGKPSKPGTPGAPGMPGEGGSTVTAATGMAADGTAPDEIAAAGTPNLGAGEVPPLPVGTVAEIMVLISAETLFGADDAPAELAGYGPISAEAARRLARAAHRWTGLVQDPATGQVLGVGRRRKVPGGLRRWLQARDQTCRFPGCGTGTARAEVDHTIPWAAGGPTEHWNLAHLCRKHHLFKTLGHWKATQVAPGVLEWISPQGRRYTTEPELTLAPRQPRQPRLREFGAPPGESPQVQPAFDDPDAKPPF